MNDLIIAGVSALALLGSAYLVWKFLNMISPMDDDDDD